MRALALFTLPFVFLACDSGTDGPTKPGMPPGDDAVLVGSYFGNGSPDEARDAAISLRFGTDGIGPGTSNVTLGFTVLDGPAGSFDDGGGTARVTLGTDGSFSFDCSGCTSNLNGAFPLQGSGTAERGRIELDVSGSLTFDGLVMEPN